MSLMKMSVEQGNIKNKRGALNVKGEHTGVWPLRSAHLNIFLKCKQGSLMC